MDVFVPFDADEPKTRLSPLLDAAERRDLAETMLADVLTALEDAGWKPTVLATSDLDCDAPVVVDDRPLSTAVDAALEDALPAAVVMADLPLATLEALDRLAAPEADVVMAPGLGGGTNALVVRHPDFQTDFHGVSARDHRQRAADADLEFATVDSFRLALDVDEPADLAEVLLHGAGETATWLQNAGVEVVSPDGRVSVRRPANSDE
ncbi:2-phospho-L-lactate guanylyltransferase [Halobacteriales archaeon Cl-PHB]